MPIKQIQVVCPDGVVSGGSESLHNLVAAISSLEASAKMVYYPFSKSSLTPILINITGLKFLS
jgi:hypothetical protein